MTRILFLGPLDEPWLVTEPELVTRQFLKPVEGKSSTQHMASNLERRATVEEVEAWRNQRA